MGGKHLLLLAASILLVRCQKKTQVSMSPILRQIFGGDRFYLNCDDGASGGAVKWYFNNTEQRWTNKTLKIVAAAPKDSGSYQCESSGQRSDEFNISVLEYVPSASLIIEAGHSVMQTGSSVLLKIENEDGLEGWNCWVCRGERTNKIKLKLQRDSVSLVFQPKRLIVPETIFWCTNSTQGCRSNQITVWTTDKNVSLEMSHLPAVAGESLTLNCRATGTDQISYTVFYKDNRVILQGPTETYKISSVTNSVEGTYKCHVTYTHSARTRGPAYREDSDIQEVHVQAHPITAVLSPDMWCSCPSCPGGMSYRYYKKNGKSWEFLRSDEKLTERGTYGCRAVWDDKRTSLSASVYVSEPRPPLAIFILIGLGMVFVILAVVAFYVLYKKRNTAEALYEDVARRSPNTDDAQYEMLQMEKREGEYDTLHPEVPTGREKKGGEYEPLRKEGMKEGEYHTLGMEGVTGGEGGYEALKKEGMKEGVYHTLQGATGGEGGTEQ